jgi:hypothetical protein
MMIWSIPFRLFSVLAELSVVIFGIKPRAKKMAMEIKNR